MIPFKLVDVQVIPLLINPVIGAPKAEPPAPPPPPARILLLLSRCVGDANETAAPPPAPFPALPVPAALLLAPCDTY